LNLKKINDLRFQAHNMFGENARKQNVDINELIKIKKIDKK